MANVKSRVKNAAAAGKAKAEGKEESHAKSEEPKSEEPKSEESNSGYSHEDYIKDNRARQSYYNADAAAHRAAREASARRQAERREARAEQREAAQAAQAAKNATFGGRFHKAAKSNRSKGVGGVAKGMLTEAGPEGAAVALGIDALSKIRGPKKDKGRANGANGAAVMGWMVLLVGIRIVSHFLNPTSGTLVSYQGNYWGMLWGVLIFGIVISVLYRFSGRVATLFALLVILSVFLKDIGILKKIEAPTINHKNSKPVNTAPFGPPQKPGQPVTILT